MAYLREQNVQVHAWDVNDAAAWRGVIAGAREIASSWQLLAQE